LVVVDIIVFFKVVITKKGSLKFARVEYVFNNFCGAKISGI